MINLTLANNITQTNRTAKLGRLDGDRQIVELSGNRCIAIAVRRNIPFLHVGALVA
jgi:hypothetical protein